MWGCCQGRLVGARRVRLAAGAGCPRPGLPFARPLWSKPCAHALLLTFLPARPHRPLPPTDTAAHGIKSSCLAFFSAGSSAASQGFVSENGLDEAARYHEATRPLEGRMKVPRPSAVAPRGARFAN